jgi:hypothetical protein
VAVQDDGKAVVVGYAGLPSNAFAEGLVAREGEDRYECKDKAD